MRIQISEDEAAAVKVEQRGPQPAVFDSVDAKRNVSARTWNGQVLHAPKHLGLAAQHLHPFHASAPRALPLDLAIQEAFALSVHHLQQRANFRCNRSLPSY